MILNGPVPWIWRTVSPTLQAKCFIRAGITANAPLLSVVGLLSSHFAPMPTLSVPESTVIFSAAGCQCGWTLYPSGNFTRIVYAPAFEGSPSSTASCAPGGRSGGAGPHFMLSKFITIGCAAAADLAVVFDFVAACPNATADIITIITEMIIFLAIVSVSSIVD